MKKFRRLGPCLAMALVASVVSGASDAGAYPTGGALSSVQVLTIDIAGKYGVPPDAVGVAMNVTVASASAGGFLTVFPCGQAVPNASNVNYRADQTVPNFVMSALANDGTVCISTYATTDVIVDIAGYIPIGSAVKFLPVPYRFLDTRTGTGVAAAVAAGSVTEVQIAGVGGVPPNASMAVFNTTAVEPTSDGFATVFPCSGSVPNASNLNFTAGTVTPSLVVSRLSARGTVCIFTTSAMHVFADVAAYAVGTPTGITTIGDPVRVLDTRIAIGGPKAKVTSAGVSVQVGGTVSVPTGAAAAIVNLTATNPTAGGFLTVYPCGGAVPNVSNVNFTTGQTVANLSIVNLSASGALCIFAEQPTDVIVDVSGYTTGTTDFVSLAPLRIFDTRLGVDPHCNLAVRNSPDRTVDVVDLTSGIVTSSWAGPAGFGSWSLKLSKNCDRYFAVGAAGGSTKTFEISISGQLMRSAYTSGTPGNVGPIVAGNQVFDQPVEVGSGGSFIPPRVRDVFSGTTVFTLPSNSQQGTVTPHSVYFFVGVNDAGDEFVFERQFDRSYIDVFSKSGVLLSETISSKGTTIGISPNANYIGFNRGAGSVQSTLTITTMDGAKVAEFGDGATIMKANARFMTNGAIELCVYSPATASEKAMRWDLFSPPKPLVPSMPNMPCVDDAA